MGTGVFDNISRYTQKNVDEILAGKIGPEYTAYRERWNRAGVDNIPDFPLHIDFELDDKCNQKCRMCPRNSKSHPNINYKLNTKSTLSFEDYRQIIDEGALKGLVSVNFGAFSEPLINKDVWTMVEYAHKKGIVDSRLITNGLLLHKHINPIFNTGLVNLFVSLDAFSKDKYEMIRGNGFEQVKSNLLMFLKEKRARNSLLPIVRVSFVDMDINREEKESFISFWKEKVDIIDIQVFDNFNVDITLPYDKGGKKKWVCKSPWLRVTVIANGDILPCCNFFGHNIPIGNIRENSIAEIWQSKAIEDIRAGIIDDSLKNCSICQRVQ